ncbi:MBL fold metallo-hydrolase [Aurantimonas sp. MSK8Z-1]|uniref:MBL fold metallo-hydrolase n=1 Tax=Mangrovibrevibacter kandeliae TaxID=2968473 RepID=UPI00211999AB|nr:MBL fold metallo-hydrolase [Aurantimonas sp. MSK8Z-1]MCW4114575.1 MBL fold metallo-hydrolase [Aurantimonas sp. MSK8Z-1]
MSPPRLRVTILGCGSSPGVPRITGDWGACDPAEPRNRRRRASALVERIGSHGKTVAVIDCGPDFREQMISAAVARLDAVLLTHPHADHIHGIDDLRGYMLSQHHRVPVHADAPTFARVSEAFGYCFETPAHSNYPPIARWVPIMAGARFTVEGSGGPIDVLPFEQVHGSIHSLGFRIGPLAYCSDVSDFPPSAIAAIAGAEHIVIDALQYREHPSHLSLGQALDWVERLRVPAASLTHMHTPLDYAALRDQLPGHVQPAYDGLVLDFDLD